MGCNRLHSFTTPLAAQPTDAGPLAALAPAVTVAHTRAAGQIRVVQQATSLGVPLVNDWDGTIDLAARHDWPSRQQLVEDRYSRLSRLQISAFGRGFASSAYGVSKLLYHAEFAGLPPPDVLAELQRATTAVVDRSEDPIARQQHFQ